MAQKYEALFWKWHTLKRRGYTDRVELAAERARKFSHSLEMFNLPDGITVQGQILEVGCGVVSMLEGLPDAEVLAIDPNLLTYSEKVPGFALLGRVKNCHYCSTLVKHVWRTGFDTVWSFNVLSHTIDWPSMIAHMHRVLRPGGLLLLGAHVANRPQNKRHKVGHPSSIRAEDLLDRVAECGFEIGGHTPLTTEPSRYMMAIWATKPQEAE